MSSTINPSGDLTLRTEYWNDLRARRAFMEFIHEIHNLDFSRWDASGYWDPAYTPFSYFQGDRVVASICIYRMNTILNGTPTPMIQISGVGTAPEWRRKRLNRRLIELGLEWAGPEPVGVFLFSNAEAVPYYQRCGFDQLEEFIETMKLSGRDRMGAVTQLNPELPHDLAKIEGYVQDSAPISNKFSLVNPRLTMFHMLYILKDIIYEIPALNCLVCFRRTGAVLKLFAIIGARIPDFAEVYPYIADPADRKIEFHFYTDKLGVTETRLEPLVEYLSMVKGSFPLEKPVFPFTMRA